MTKKTKNKKIKSWTTVEQREWLTERLQGYIDARKLRLTNRFLTEVNEQWFHRFPLRLELFPGRALTETLTPSEIAAVQSRIPGKKEQIKNWLNWNCRDNYSRNKAEAKDKVAAKYYSNLTVATKSSSRVLQRVEAYQKLYPTETREAIARAMGPKPWDPENHMRTRREVTESMLECAPQEVQDRVDEFVAADTESKKGGKDSDDYVGDGPKTPRQYSEALDVLPDVVMRMLESIAGATGWTFCLLGGGPSPRHNGRLFTECYNFGQKSPAGSDFPAAFVDFDEKIMKPWYKYVGRAYTIDIQMQRSLTGLVAQPAATDQPDAEAQVLQRQENGEVSLFNQPCDGTSGIPPPNCPSPTIVQGISTAASPNPVTPAAPSNPSTPSVLQQGHSNPIMSGNQMNQSLTTTVPSLTPTASTNPYVTEMDLQLYNDILSMPPAMMGMGDGWNLSGFEGGVGTGNGYLPDFNLDFNMYDHDYGLMAQAGMGGLPQSSGGIQGSQNIRTVPNVPIPPTLPPPTSTNPASEAASSLTTIGSSQFGRTNAPSAPPPPTSAISSSQFEFGTTNVMLPTPSAPLRPANTVSQGTPLATPTISPSTMPMAVSGSESNPSPQVGRAALREVQVPNSTEQGENSETRDERRGRKRKEPAEGGEGIATTRTKRKIVPPPRRDQSPVARRSLAKKKGTSSA